MIPIEKISGFLKSYYTLSRTFRRWHMFVCAADLLPLSRKCNAPRTAHPPPVATGPPDLAAERYVKDQVPCVTRRTPVL
jgi:hypothetical protein